MRPALRLLAIHPPPVTIGRLWASCGLLGGVPKVIDGQRYRYFFWGRAEARVNESLVARLRDTIATKGTT